MNQQVDQRDFTDRYNTKLSDEDEFAFWRWVQEQSEKRGYDVGNDLYDYDLRGAWQELNSGKMKKGSNGHLGDKYKKPNHKTFSDQSIYNGADGYVGGQWTRQPGVGQVYVMNPTNMWSEEELIDYFNHAEPNVAVRYSTPDDPRGEIVPGSQLIVPQRTSGDSRLGLRPPEE